MLWNLEGSIFQWANEGRDLQVICPEDGTAGEPAEPESGASTTSRRSATVVHPFDHNWGQLLDKDKWSRDLDVVGAKM